ncbi:GNAT family N-acetyltransferase [Sphingomonas sp.]|uniref:GNAT family N-acetyltransferase n=1 Tax=Sphingomonas sp. TaxID=28214 RepID=UPI002E3203EE|nr:GNAT family N-acetyltransferase [Sphingomonas sp.]HEX4695893.1 GNAT family N-acetyltransferase [Sphingomonas sp.]
MSEQFRIAPVANDIDLCAAAGLFDDYARSLPVDLGYQEFAAELAGLPGKYAAPAGALLLARGSSGAAVGCVALRPLGDGVCEMKRLFVARSARGLGLGAALAEAIVAAARDRGYRELRLDTLSSMARAAALYRAMGFEPIAPYYGPTPAGTVFMALQL